MKRILLLALIALTSCSRGPSQDQLVKACLQDAREIAGKLGDRVVSMKPATGIVKSGRRYDMAVDAVIEGRPGITRDYLCTYKKGVTVAYSAGYRRP